MACPHKRSDMTPCVIEDGDICYGFAGLHDQSPVCVGCGRGPATTGVPAPEGWDEQVRQYLDAQRRREQQRQRR